MLIDLFVLILLSVGEGPWGGEIQRNIKWRREIHHKEAIANHTLDRILEGKNVCHALGSYSILLYTVESKGVWQECFQMHGMMMRKRLQRELFQMEAVEVAEWDLHRLSCFQSKKAIQYNTSFYILLIQG